MILNYLNRKWFCTIWILSLEREFVCMSKVWLEQWNDCLFLIHTKPMIVLLWFTKFDKGIDPYNTLITMCGTTTLWSKVHDNLPAAKVYSLFAYKEGVWWLRCIWGWDVILQWRHKHPTSIVVIWNTQPRERNANFIWYQSSAQGNQFFS